MSQQSELARQLRGIDPPQHHNVELQARYITEWAEEQLRTVCPLTTAYLDLNGMLTASIETLLREECRPRSLTAFRLQFLTQIMGIGGDVGALAAFEQLVDGPDAALATGQDDCLARALAVLGIQVAP